MMHVEQRPMLLELSKPIGSWSARYRIPATDRARALYMESGEHKVVTAIGHWDENNAIFRCAVVCPDCRYRPCKGRICGGSYMTTRSIFATGASTVALASSSLQDRPAAKRSISFEPAACYCRVSSLHVPDAHMSFAKTEGERGP